MPIFKLLPDGRTERRLVLAALVDSTGTGLYIAGSALYYTTQLGFSPRQIGLGLSLMGLVGLLVTVPIGRLVDQFGPRRVLVALNLWRAVGFGAEVHDELRHTRFGVAQKRVAVSDRNYATVEPPESADQACCHFPVTVARQRFRPS